MNVEPVVKKKSGLVVIITSVTVLAAGYICLALGSITVAPILIIGSFVGMGIGIWIGWD